jgi:hypothetical protein
MKRISLIALFLAAASSLAAESPLGQSLSGTWSCAVSTTGTVPGVPASYPGIITFLADGNLLGEAFTDGGLAKSYGVWLRVGDRQFRSTWIGYDQDSALKVTASYKILYNFALQDDLTTLLGAYRLDLFDAKGTKIFSFSGKAKCTRLEVEDFTDIP